MVLSLSVFKEVFFKYFKHLIQKFNINYALSILDVLELTDAIELD